MWQAKRGDFTASCGFVGPQRKVRQPRPEKPNARAKEPKPPRVTLPWPESVEVADDERPDEVSLPKKPKRDDDRLYPPPDDPRDVQPVLLCGIAGAAIPGGVGWQFSLGISA
jgi:hypothetical protein